jgi:replicative DNA helicase
MSQSLSANVSLQDKETEEAVIGSILIGGNATFDEAARILVCKDLYSERLRVVWEAFAAIVADGQMIDSYIVNDRVKGKAGVDFPLLMELANKGNYLRIRQYAEIVRRKSIARASLLMFEEQRRRIMAGNDPREVLSQAMTDAAKQLDSRRQDDPVHIKDVVPVVMEEIENRLQNAGKLLGVPTGFGDLDTLINGIRGITILAARPSMGKTTMALNIAQNTSDAYPVLFFSLEMEREELAEKLLSSEGNLFGRVLEKPSLMNDFDWAILVDSAGKLYEKNIWIDDSSDTKASEIAVRARRMAAQHGIKLIVVDYLQLIKPERPTGNRNYEISETMRIVKELSKELKIPILLLSQLSRDIEKRKDPTPMNSDLRDSGSLEQDAHIIIFLFSRSGETDKDIFSVNARITKNRKGRKNVELEFTFYANRSKFLLPLKYHYQEGDGGHVKGETGGTTDCRPGNTG